MNFVGFATLHKTLSFTRNLFAPPSTIEGKRLIVLERNPQGDCLCLSPNRDYLVDVDYRDVEKYEPNGPSPDFVAIMALAALATRRSAKL